MISRKAVKNKTVPVASQLLTHLPLEILRKSGFLVAVVLYRAKTHHKAVCRSFTWRPSDPDAKY